MCGTETRGARPSYPLPWLAGALPLGRSDTHLRLKPSVAIPERGPTGAPGPPSWSAEFRAGHGEPGPSSQVHLSAVPGRRTPPEDPPAV